MYQLYQNSKVWSTRPSDFLGIPSQDEFSFPINELLRFDIDSSVAQFGEWIVNKSQIIDEETYKPKFSIKKLLDTPYVSYEERQRRKQALKRERANREPLPLPNIIRNPRKKGAKQ